MAYLSKFTLAIETTFQSHLRIRMKTQEEVIALLNSLLKENCDAKRGYQHAAKQIEEPALKGLLMSLAEQRENFKKSIREEVRLLGSEPVQHTKCPGPVQNAFDQPDLLTVLNTVEQTISGCLQLEINRLTKYEQMLNGQSFEQSTQRLLVGQRENIKLSQSDMKKNLLALT